MPEKFIVIVGSIIDGVTIHGPFDDFESADEYSQDFDIETFITTLHNPDRRNIFVVNN